MSEQIFNTKDLICKILMLKGEKGDPGTNVDTAARQMIENEATTRAQEIARLQRLIDDPEVADGSITEQKLADDAVTTPKIEDGAVTYPKLATDAFRLRFTNVSVAASAFVNNSTYPDYPKRASVQLTGATAQMRPDVCFSVADAISGNFAPVAESYAGGIYIYAKTATAITIPVIDLVR